MLRRHKRLLIPAFLIVVFTIWWGCTQPEDIVVGKSTTVFHLAAERLPTTPTGMAYQLWAAEDLAFDETLGDTFMGSIPLDDPFLYDFEADRFLELDGTRRPDSNRFEFHSDILNYGWIFMTVQHADGSGPVPGPVMLMDTVTPADFSQMDMVFPGSGELWPIAVYFNMETPSNGRSTASDGAGIWFSSYTEHRDSVQDTTGLASWTIDTNPPLDHFSEEQGDCVTSIVNILNVHTEMRDSVYGFDTLSWEVVRYDAETYTECDTGQGNLFTTRVSLTYDMNDPREFNWDDFRQTADSLPDLRRMGWWYEGWVVSSVISDLGVGVGPMTPPAWVGLNQHDSLIRGIDGGLLSTGLFYSLDLPDEGNPYVDNPIRVPPFPGEDFLRHLPPNDENVAVNLVPGGQVRTGTAFIAVHPTNSLDDNTNFPLIIQRRDLPRDRFSVEDDQQQFVMYNMTNTNSFGMGQTVGMPQVRVSIRRF